MTRITSEYPLTPVSQVLANRQAILEKINLSIQRGNCCRVLGPRNQGKSKLLREAIVRLEKQGTHYTSYQTMNEAPLLGEAGFLNHLIRNIARDIHHAGEEVEIPSLGPTIQFQYVLLDLIRGCDRNLALFIDDLEMAPPNLIANLLGVLRAAFINTVDQPGPRFQAIVCGSLNLSQLALVGASRFESVSDLVFIDDLNDVERHALLHAILSEEGDITLAPDGESAFFEWTGGDALMIQLFAVECTHYLRKAPQETILTADLVKEAAGNFIDRPRPHHKILEVYKEIESDPDLLSCMLMIFDKGEVPQRELPLPSNENPNLLDLCGVFESHKGSYRFNCPLWFRLLKRRFTPDHVGRLYAITGDWPRAIYYYGQAIHESQIDKQSDLFAATINAMHASEDRAQAFGFLAQGLQANYPTCDIHLYDLTEASLVRVYATRLGRASQEIFLDEGNRPEIEALKGPDYSIATIGEVIRYLVPLRVASGRRTVGLASFCEHFSPNPPYQRREETLQLLGFLRKATQAIESRTGYARLLEDAENQADSLSNLNKILTHILNHPQFSQEITLRLVLAGVTCGWGLRFNRACLFLAEETRQELVGAIGVGHLRREDADKDWRNFPYQTLDDLMEALATDSYRYSDLHYQVKGLAIPRLPAQTELFGTHDPLNEAYWSSEPMVQNKVFLLGRLPETFIEAIDPPLEYALVPLQAGQRKLGVLYVDDKFTQRPITDVRLQMLQTFVNQAILVMENLRALNVEKRQTLILSELLSVEEVVNQGITKSISELLEIIAQSARQLMNADCAVVYSLHPAKPARLTSFESDHVAPSGLRAGNKPVQKIRSTRGIAARVIKEGRVEVSDIQSYPTAHDGSKLLESPFIKSEGIQAFVAVRLGPREEPVGILFINWRSSHDFLPEEVSILTAFANFAGVAIPSARRHQQVQDDLKRRSQELEAITEVLHASLEFRSDEEIDKVIHAALQSIREMIYLSRLFLIRPGPRGGYQEYRPSTTEKTDKTYLQDLQHEIVLQVLTSGKSYLEEADDDSGSDRLPACCGPDARCVLALPVKKSGNCLAVLYMESPDPEGITPDHKAFLEHLCNRLALTLHQSEIYQVLRRLLEIAWQVGPEPNLDDIIASLVENAMDSMYAVDAITIYYEEKETGQLKLGRITGVWDESSVRRYFPLQGNLVDKVLHIDQPIFAENVSNHPLLKGDFVTREKVISSAALPLKVGDERVGCIFFNYRRKRHFDQAEIVFLEMFAQIAAIAIHRAILQDKAERHKKRLEAAAAITPIIAEATPDLDLVYHSVLVETLKAIPKANNGCIVELVPDMSSAGDRHRLMVKPVTQEFYRADRTKENGVYEIGSNKPKGIASRVIQSGIAEIVQDVNVDDDYIPAIHSTRSELCIPILVNGKAQQAIVLESITPGAFTEEDKTLVKMLAEHVAIAIQNVQQVLEITRERMINMAAGMLHDIRNIVANIPDIVDELRDSLEAGDDFKQINACLHDLQISAEGTKRINQFLSDFFQYRRFHPVRTKLGPIIDRAIEDTCPDRPQNVQVLIEPSLDLPEISVDGLLIELLLKNLISNAQTSIPPECAGQVVIRTDHDESSVYIMVKDNGKGISQENKKKLFMQEFTTKADNPSLHGFGLFHCRQIVDMHQGDINVDSELGKGSIFTVILPRNGE